MLVLRRSLLYAHRSIAITYIHVSGLEPDEEQRKPYFCLYMLAMACGMQNGMTTRYSGAVVRTTHLTGMFTDMGLLIGHLLRSDRDFQDMWKFSLFVPIILGKLCYAAMLLVQLRLTHVQVVNMCKAECAQSSPTLSHYSV
jgi:Protein of unknown function (DUF1275)